MVTDLESAASMPHRLDAPTIGYIGRPTRGDPTVVVTGRSSKGRRYRCRNERK